MNCPISNIVFFNKSHSCDNAGEFTSLQVIVCWYLMQFGAILYFSTIVSTINK
jgi:hypothetical protein